MQVLARAQASGLALTSSSSRPRALQRPAAPARRSGGASVQAFFNFGKKKAAAVEAPVKRPTVVPEPSLNVPLGLLAIAAGAGVEGWTPLAALAGVLGAFLAFQSTRVKFVFDDDALEVVIAGKEEQQTENAFVGGRNRWRYDTFVNWELWWPGFPVLVYFKETQTKPEGQIHFFPVIFDGRQLYEVMLERCGPTQTSGRKGAADGDEEDE